MPRMRRDRDPPGATVNATLQRLMREAAAAGDRERVLRLCTRKQRAVLDALAARPDYWITEPSDLADAAGLTERGTQTVLYHLVDAGVVYYDDGGYRFTEPKETP